MIKGKGRGVKSYMVADPLSSMDEMKKAVQQLADQLECQRVELVTSRLENVHLKKEMEKVMAKTAGAGAASGGKVSAGKLEGFSGDESGFSDWSFKVRCHLSMLVEGAVECLD